jgi:hypothetical protein
MSATHNAPADPPPGRSTVRKAGLVAIGFVSIYVALLSTVQILNASLWPEISATKYTCRSGTRALYQSVEQARLRAAHITMPEREALVDFRNQLQPVWSQEPAVRALCEKDGDQEALSALRSVELLRYAEERSVRYSAIDLTMWRERAPRQVGALNAPEEKN